MSVAYHWSIDPDDRFNCPFYQSSGRCGGNGSFCNIAEDSDSCPILYWAGRMDFKLEMDWE